MAQFSFLQQSHSLWANPLHLNVDLSEKLANVREREEADAGVGGEPIVGGQPESQSDPRVGSHFNQVSPQSGGKVGWDGPSHLFLKLLLTGDVVDRWTDFIDGMGRWAKDSRGWDEQGYVGVWHVS